MTSVTFPAGERIAVAFKDVWKRYGDQRPVFEALDAEVPQAGFTFVVGRSGVGKSVFCRLAVALERPDQGRVELFGERVDQLPERKVLPLRRQAPYLVQGPALLDWLSLLQNVALAGPGRDEAHALEALGHVGLRDVAHRLPTQVGPGVRKRAAIARALVLGPRYLVLDEPTTGLDKPSARQVSDVLVTLREEGLGALVVSHDYPLLQRLGDRVILVLERGVRIFGSAEDFLSSDDPEAQELLAPVRAEMARHG